jgi:hypothetical protein
MSLSRARRDVARSRLFSGLLALGLVGAQGASLAHFALVKHAYCPEHGELIHPDAEYRAPSAERHSSKPGLYAAEAAEREHGHDHCALAGHRRDSALPARTATSLIQADHRSAVAPDLASVPPSLPRFRVAPKQSPPA